MTDNVTANPGTGGAVFATDDIGGVQYPRSKVCFGDDGVATDTSASNPLPVRTPGGAGADHSPNRPSLPPGGLTLLTTIDANAARNRIEVQNQDVAQLILVRDDGAGGNQTLIICDGAVATNAQGGGWSSTTFRGRLKIYGSSGAVQFAAYED